MYIYIYICVCTCVHVIMYVYMYIYIYVNVYITYATPPFLFDSPVLRLDARRSSGRRSRSFGAGLVDFSRVGLEVAHIRTEMGTLNREPQQPIVGIW